MYYIVSPKDVVAAKPRDLDDHISWLLQKEHYEEALNAAQGRFFSSVYPLISFFQENEKGLQQHDIEKIGSKYLEYLLEHGQAEKAASLCPQILKKEQKSWENWIYNFAGRNQLKAIGPYIPVNEPKLSTVVYEMVLGNYLKNGLFYSGYIVVI